MYNHPTIQPSNQRTTLTIIYRMSRITTFRAISLTTDDVVSEYSDVDDDDDDVEDDGVEDENQSEEESDVEDQSEDDDAEDENQSEEMSDAEDNSDDDKEEIGEYCDEVSIERLYNDGTLQSLDSYKNGKLDGESKEWDEYGNLQSVDTYKQGSLHGELKRWSEGKLVRLYNYRDGKIDGKVLVVDHTIDEKNYKMGKYHGIHTIHFVTDDGEKKGLKLKEFYVNGLLEGVVERYNESGLLLERSHYENGQLHGDSYGSNNDYQTFLKYYRGVKHKNERVIDSHGNTITDLNYDHGRQIGLGKKTIEHDNEHKTETHYFNDQKHGTFREWDQDGVLILEINYHYDIIHGISKSWKRGKISSVCSYHNDVIEGESRIWINKSKRRDYVASRIYYIEGRIWEGYYKNCKWSLQTKRVFLSYKRKLLKRVRGKVSTVIQSHLPEPIAWIIALY